eukprot:TRINITY_DN175_c0_g1_i1.p1 TRINITY_DN175_c0_g1~~TRINITY_DN175_c0_g1_i1.p1  ORF type:complete len:199 (+),score=15.08 TRINITY_DN175_c0_g1_i1:57-653(+)
MYISRLPGPFFSKPLGRVFKSTSVDLSIPSVRFAPKLLKFQKLRDLRDKALTDALGVDKLLDSGRPVNQDCSFICQGVQGMTEKLLLYVIKKHGGGGVGGHSLSRMAKLAEQKSGQDFKAEETSRVLNELSMCAKSFRYEFGLECGTFFSILRDIEPFIDSVVKYCDTPTAELEGIVVIDEPPAEIVITSGTMDKEID